MTIVLPVIAALYLLWPTYRAWQLGSTEESYRNSKDSVGLANFQRNQGADLADAMAKRMKLGLDLQGGMYVTLEADVVKLLEESAQKETKDEIFAQVIEKTRRETENTDEQVLDVFLRNFNAIARPQGRTLISYFDTGDLSDVSEDKIIERLRFNIDGAIDQAKEVISQRINKYGVSEANIQKQGTRRIVLELPGVKDPEEMRKLIQTTARLEFKLVRNNRDIVRAFYKIDEYLARQNKNGGVQNTAGVTLAKGDTNLTQARPDNTGIGTDGVADTSKKDVAAATAAKQDSAAIAKADSLKADSTAKALAAAAADTTNPYAGLSPEETTKRYMADHPFTSLFYSAFLQGDSPVEINYIKDQFPEGEYFFRIPEQNIQKFEDYLERADVKRLIPAEYSVALSAKSEGRNVPKGQGVFDIYGLKADPELTGDVVSDAMATFDPSNNAPMVIMRMNSEGAERWARITGANIQKRVAIVLDERVYSAPVVQAKITGGSSQISGSADIKEAQLLQIVLKAGALKTPVKIMEERVVGPSLGEDSIKSGITASLIAFSLVILFMILYYRTGGLVADIAVLINLLLMIAVLAGFKGTLTLPGIAGIILTVGMAVDANIIIYERIREELAIGRSLRAAIDEGYSLSLSAIIDSNITTFLTGLILFLLGTGPIQGFALTLMIGIGTTLFTAIFVTRAIIELMVANGATSLNFGQTTTPGAARA
jgi:preprotein translocase subunit SecD